MLTNCDIKQVTELLGLQPSKKTTFELRFGNRGSLSVNLKSNVWYDHEQMVGGGILDLIVHCGEARDRSGSIQFLKDKGLIANVEKKTKTKPILRSHIYRYENGEPNRKATKYLDGNWKQFGWFEGEWRPTVIQF